MKKKQQLLQTRLMNYQIVVVVFYLNSQYQTGNKPNYMEANKRMLRMRHWGGCYFKWKILIPGGTTNRYNENLKRPWYCRLPCWKQLHGEGKTTRKTLYLMYWTNRANRKRPFVICLYISLESRVAKMEKSDASALSVVPYRLDSLRLQWPATW